MTLTRLNHPYIRTWSIAVLMAAMLQSAWASDAPVPTPPPTDPLTAASVQLKDKNFMIRRQGVATLSRIRTPEAVELILKALEDKHPLVRSAAADALGRRHIRTASGELARLLRKDKSEKVRQQAAVALGFLGDLSTTNDLISALSDTSDGVRFAAAATLGRLRAKDSRKKLEELLSNTSVGMRRAAATSLGQIAHPASIKALTQSLEDQDMYVRREAVRGLGLIGSPEALNPLPPLLEDPEALVRAQTAVALSPLSGEVWEKAAIELLTHSQPSIRQQAASALGASNKTNKGLEALQKALEKEKNASVINGIQYAIDQIKRKHSGGTP